MNSNVGIQNVATIAWDGTTSFASSIKKFVRFGFSFEVVVGVGTEAVFKVQSAPPSAADKCVPGVFTDVAAIAICQTPAVGALAEIKIPQGSQVGTICAGTIPCRPNEFIRIVAVSGDTANVRAVMIRQGPMI